MVILCVKQDLPTLLPLLCTVTKWRQGSPGNEASSDLTSSIVCMWLSRAGVLNCISRLSVYVPCWVVAKIIRHKNSRLGEGYNPNP